MKQLILISALLFSNLAVANFSGTWTGKLNINGKVCKATAIEIRQTPEAFFLMAAENSKGEHAIECGTPEHKYYMYLEEYYSVKGIELWRYEMPMGAITDAEVFGKDGECSARACETWDYFKIVRLDENKMNIWIDFNGAVLTGELAR